MFRRKSLSILVALANAPCSIVAMLLLLSRTRVRLAHAVKLEARMVVRRKELPPRMQLEKSCCCVVCVCVRVRAAGDVHV